MTALVKCAACQHGNHSLHKDVVESISPERRAQGVCGGKVCPCRGECEDPKRDRS